MTVETSNPVANKQMLLAITVNVVCDRELISWPAEKQALTDELNERITEALQHSSLMDAVQVHFSVQEQPWKSLPERAGVYLCASQVPATTGFEIREPLAALGVTGSHTELTDELRQLAEKLANAQPNKRAGYFDAWLEDDLGVMLEDSFEHLIL